MKKLTILILLSIFLITGCQDDNSILEPDNNYAKDEMTKGRPILSLDTEDKIILGNDEFGELEEDEANNNPTLNNRENTEHEKLRVKQIDVKTKHSKILTINSDKGGKIYLYHKWKNDNDQNSKLKAVLDIPLGAFKGNLTFEIIFDVENYAVELYPSPYKFDKPLLLDLVFENVDLTDFDPNVFVFDYLDGDEPENLIVKSVDMDIKNNRLNIKEAELHHFSRYGWTRSRTKK